MQIDDRHARRREGRGRAKGCRDAIWTWPVARFAAAQAR